MTKGEIRQAFNQGTLSLWVSDGFYEIKQYIRNYYRVPIKFTEVTRPGPWDTWNKKLRYSFALGDIMCYFNESDTTFVVIKADDGIVYYNITEVLRRK